MFHFIDFILAHLLKTLKFMGDYTQRTSICVVAGFQGNIVSSLHKGLLLAQCSIYHETPQLSHIQCYGLGFIFPIYHLCHW